MPKLDSVRFLTDAAGDARATVRVVAVDHPGRKALVEVLSTFPGHGDLRGRPRWVPASLLAGA